MISLFSLIVYSYWRFKSSAFEDSIALKVIFSIIKVFVQSLWDIQLYNCLKVLFSPFIYYTYSNRKLALLERISNDYFFSLQKILIVIFAAFKALFFITQHNNKLVQSRYRMLLFKQICKSGLVFILSVNWYSF